MREVNQAGAAVPFRHFGNFSITATGKPYMHDLGDQTSLTIENMHSDEQFVAETFAQLAYALTPRKIAVPVPGPETSYRSVLVEHVDDYMRTTLDAYYQDESVASLINFEDFEEAFFTAPGISFPNLRLVSATIHSAKIGEWLDDYRTQNCNKSSMNGRML